MKKWLRGFLFKKAGRAQMIGWLVALVGGSVYGRANPEFVTAIKEHAEVIVAGIVAIIAAVDVDKVVDANKSADKEGK